MYFYYLFYFLQTNSITAISASTSWTSVRRTTQDISSVQDLAAKSSMCPSRRQCEKKIGFNHLHEPSERRLVANIAQYVVIEID